MALQKPRYDTLDAWRGLACLLVVVFHSIPYATGWEFDTRVRSTGGSFAEWMLVVGQRFWIGVPLFFVISGYCIAACAESVRVRGGGVGRYFVRRFRRIYPPLAAAMALAVVISLLLPAALTPPPSPDGGTLAIEPGTLTAVQWLGNLTLTEEWRPALGGPPKHYLLGQTWTLCYEEQFYFVVGALLLISRRYFFPGIAVVTGLVMLNLVDLNAVIGQRIGADLSGVHFGVPGLFTNGLWIPFAAGVAVYYRLHLAGERGRTLIPFGLVLLGLYWAVGESSPFDTRQSLAKYNVVGCAFALALCWLHPFDRSLSTTRLLAPVRLCGRMCYSLYLTHTLVTIPVAWAFYRAGVTSPAATILVVVPVAVVSSGALGYLFYRIVERRFLNPPTASTPISTPVDHLHIATPTRNATPMVEPAYAGAGSSALSSFSLNQGDRWCWV